MGWEWHNRRRGIGGRFARHLTDAGQQQIHLRTTNEVGELIRKYARDANEEIGQYILRAVAQRIKRDHDERLPVDG